MPDAMRFHFNAHSLIVYGRKGSDYLISDPVFDYPVVCSRKDLMKARFAEGLLAPKGKMYYLSDVPEKVDFPRAIQKGSEKPAGHDKSPLHRCVGHQDVLESSRDNGRKNTENARLLLYLGHAIRMQEEIGTGGGGFRLMYAAFLHEAAHITGDDRSSGDVKKDDGHRRPVAGVCLLWREDLQKQIYRW